MYSMSDAKEILKHLALEKAELLKDKTERDKKRMERKKRMEALDKLPDDISEDKPTPKKRGRPKKTNIMKARSDIDGKVLTTMMNVKAGLSHKEKKALKDSVMDMIREKTGKGFSIQDEIAKQKGYWDKMKANTSIKQISGGSVYQPYAFDTNWY